MAEQEKQEMDCRDRTKTAMDIVWLLDTGEKGWEDKAVDTLRIALHLILPGWNVAIKISSLG